MSAGDARGGGARDDDARRDAAADVGARAAALIEPYKRRTWELVGAGPGRRLLDVGCGGGADTLQLAQHVGVEGLVAGVDPDRAALDAARRRAVAAGLATRTLHATADAAYLPFVDDAFDGARCDRVVQHLTDAPAAVAELRRTTRPGGRVVLAESDHGSFSLHVRDRAAAARLGEHLFARHLVDAWAGRRLRGLLLAGGLHDVAAEAHPLVITDVALFRAVVDWDGNRGRLLDDGVAGEGELRALEDELAELDAAGAFWCSLLVVVASGVVPGTAP